LNVVLSPAVLGRCGAVLHHPLIADCAEAVCRFPTHQQHAAEYQNRGTETDPNSRANMHPLIIGNVDDDCKHSRINKGETMKGR
jgi:hypothetical protein